MSSINFSVTGEEATAGKPASKAFHFCLIPLEYTHFLLLLDNGTSYQISFLRNNA